MPDPPTDSDDDPSRYDVESADTGAFPPAVGLPAPAENPDFIDIQLREQLRHYLDAQNELRRLELAITDQKKLLADLEGRLRGMV